MTEQEKRERTIRKMRCETKTQCAIHMTTEKCYECRTCLAEMFYDAGYRKADEVRKEMAKDILDAVDSESNGQTTAITNILRKKFGVEGL